MKIKCKRGYNAKEILLYLTEYIEKKYSEYLLLNEDIEINIPLKGKDGKICPENDKVICFKEEERKFIQDLDKISKKYYESDALTGLYNRSKYERDIEIFQVMGYAKMICIYIDVVGLHEINNYLGHKAGDHMLRFVAEEIQKHFPMAFNYRIGGDEFVVLYQHSSPIDITQKIFSLRQEIRKQKYEISIGVCESSDQKTLNEIIDKAENAMRQDKMEFYQKHGGLRQVRSLNYELEKLLLEKEDASHFLNIIAPKYKGVYIVNGKTDYFRYIYVSPYFQEILEKNKGIFSLSMKDYCHMMVRPEYYAQFEKVFDYDYVEKELKSGNTIEFIYQKLDGSFVELKITIYDPNALDNHEMLWIFSDKKHSSKLDNRR